MLVLTVGSFSVFGEISQMTVNYQSDLAALEFPSFLFFLYILLIYQGLSITYYILPIDCLLIALDAHIHYG